MVGVPTGVADVWGLPGSVAQETITVGMTEDEIEQLCVCNGIKYEAPHANTEPLAEQENAANALYTLRVHSNAKSAP